jgi:hypothetical protein
MRPSQITRELKKNGLAGLHEAGLLEQIGYLCHDHERFKKLLMTVEPGKRELCYRAMAPKLPFKPKPLDVYISEAGREAEIKKLPIYDHATGEMHDHDWVDPRKAIDKAAHDALLEHSLTLCCVKCTREEEFKSWVPTAAMASAQKLGWVRRDDGNWICPKCPAIRLT